MDSAVKWREVINNPFFQNVSYKVELKKFGQILMSPASNWLGILQFNIGSEIKTRKKGGVVIVECLILTSEGVNVASVAWASDEFFAGFADMTPYPKAPEICVEVVSPGNSRAEIEEKIRLYPEKGALEVWIASAKGKVNFFTRTGEIKKSKVVENFKL